MYATLSADYARERTLDKMKWYRVVLDEVPSNFGRQQTSTQRRWCLTGTPIWNKLDDLTSLAHFLRLPPLSTRIAFQKHILSPLSDGGVDFSKPLRAYIEAYCLRRNRTCLTLPSFKPNDVTLQLSFQERQLYNKILDKTRWQIDSLVSKRHNTACGKLFIAMLRMRMLCNLGTFPWTGTSKGALGRRHLGVGCERCSATDEDTLMLLENCSFCPDCERPLSLPSPLPEPVDDQGSVLDHNRPDEDMALDNVACRLTVRKNPSPRDGFSTKLSAVVQNVMCGGADDKSIIFSYWTSTLDLLSQLLGQANIAYRQVDGRTSYIERSKALKAFREDPEVLVLLMSIETGTVGLNLTVANKVHIVEPQWNPSIEEQAIARALRMGQTREVTIIRYMMEDTVEQNVVSLQQKKKQLAKFTLDIGTDSPSDLLEDLRSIFDAGLK